MADGAVEAFAGESGFLVDDEAHQPRLSHAAVAAVGGVEGGGERGAEALAPAVAEGGGDLAVGDRRAGAGALDQ